jgi:hypothetical protein
MTLAGPRAEERAAFLKDAGWADAEARAMAGDASTRSYERLLKGGGRAVLMNAPPAAEGAACPPDASPEERRALGYNALARLAGPNLNAFLAVADSLRGAGLSAPEVYFADARRGFALLEDLGDDLFARAVASGADEETLYAAAIDALLALREAAPRAPARAGYQMLDYDRTALEAETMLVPQWYCPFVAGAAPDDRLQADYIAAWSETLAKLSPPSSIVMRDFHAENLLWLPDRAGWRKAGVLDFQDALVGSPAYDLVSLLEDARRDVTQATTEAMISRYIKGAERQGAFDADAFRADYAILGAQRNAKILGIFARLVRRDGKARYADLLPRVEAHFRGDLRHPALAPVKAVFAHMLPGRF